MKNKKLFFYFIIIVCLACIYAVYINYLNYHTIFINDLSKKSTHQIKTDNLPNSLLLFVKGYSKTGGTLVTHSSNKTNIPIGNVDLIIGGDHYNNTAQIMYIPNGQDEGNLIIKYKFDPWHNDFFQILILIIIILLFVYYNNRDSKKKDN
jgi:hypothetical protein